MLQLYSCNFSQAPSMTAQDTATFSASTALQEIVLEMLDIVLQFDGLQRSRTRITVKDEHLFHGHMHPRSCHLARITRMLRSLRLLGRGRESIALFEALDDAPGDVPGLKWTLGTWQEATFEPLTDEAAADSQPGTAVQQPMQDSCKQCKKKKKSTTNDKLPEMSLPWGIRSWQPSDPIFNGKVRMDPGQRPSSGSSVYENSPMYAWIWQDCSSDAAQVHS